MGLGTRSTPDKLPEQFGKYSILGHLATGGMAEVYIARAAGIQGFEKIVVIKRIRPELIGDDATTDLFLQEARLVATLEHPNIAQVYEIGLVNDSYFFVMEYVHGADLRQLMERAVQRGRPVSLADAVYVMIDVCAALHYAHEKRDLDGNELGLIHRDVSPSNVLISHDGAVKVCDFGIAKATQRSAETVRGVLKGKFGYMSPEQCRSEPLDRRSDLFSIGILLFELTTLTRLFQADSDYEALRAIVEEPVPDPSARVTDYPPELARIIARALAKAPADRYPTAQAIQIELEAFARERKLAMSSVNIAALMGELFEKRVDAWIRAQRAGTPLGDHLVDTSVRHSGQIPVFLPLGSSGESGEPEVAEPTPNVRTAPVVRGVPRPSPLWVLAAFTAGAIAAGVSIAGWALGKSDRDGAIRQLDADAERIASTLDGTARAARLRADGLATTPMLRAAIETDAATFADLARSEFIFRPGAGEVLEVFQLHDGGPVSLLRVPATAPASAPPAPGQDTHVLTDGASIVIVANAPISAQTGAVRGALVVSQTVDLAMVERYLGPHAERAVLAGLTTELPLIQTGAAAPASGGVRIPITTSLGAAAANLVLVATPKAAANLGWVNPVRYASLGLAGVLLIVYTIGVGRSRRPRP